ncbi:hypothetical protein JANAI62_09100 [Jannaschia pagri]|uniref:Periplasmic copper-binding protein NosD beta helix domain-containing protein n=1 Tax=Jannaschia pagri TaxID=2829797 RepID=A0ABQ4NJN1_9RHOB|nr:MULTISPECIES: right-handed parallel beta-helix repeat-containing protein [unclassified Jannaschia]GIT89605.1 hypothetical protein JANAI61_00630 [Jannaschia sp. AI_61]GIT94287.1 hypothetical protein JANAI62_09100 [Jannaschia sp. AI_62]
MVNRALERQPIVTAMVAAMLVAASGNGAGADGGLSFLSAPAFDDRPVFQAPPQPAPAPNAANPANAPAALAPQGGMTGSLLDIPTPLTQAPATAPLVPLAPAPAATPLLSGPTRATVTAPAFDTPSEPVAAEADDPQPVEDPLAVPQYDRALASRLAKMAARLGSGSADMIPSTAEVWQAAGLPEPVAKVAGFSPSQPLPLARPSMFNLRLALAMLSQGRPRQDDERIRLAQGDKGDQVLSLSGGQVTLAVIQQALANMGLQQDPQGPLRVPVILAEDTVLTLNPGDMLEMSRPDGAFVLSFGRVEIEGATIRSVGPENEIITSFAPFLAVAGSGALRMRQATIEGLGFGDTAKFGGISVLGHVLRPMSDPTEITDNTFTDVTSLAITGVREALVSGNRFGDMRGGAVRLYNSPKSHVTGNLFYGAASTNAIRILDRSHEAVLSGNVLLAGERAGIVVRRSNAADIRGNVVWGRDGAGVKLQETECSLVARNQVLDSRQKGVEIRSSAATTVRSNVIAGNRSAGVWISAQSRDALTEVTSNRLLGNGSGIVGATAATVALDGNDMTAQLPRLSDGDLTEAALLLARDLTGATPLTLTGAEAVPPAPISCGGDAT